MIYDETWSYSYDRIEQYLSDCGAARGEVSCDSSDGSVYLLENCEVTISPLPERTVGKLSLPQTRIRISGPGSEDFYHGFYLHFLSGGA